MLNIWHISYVNFENNIKLFQNKILPYTCHIYFRINTEYTKFNTKSQLYLQKYYYAQNCQNSTIKQLHPSNQAFINNHNSSILSKPSWRSIRFHHNVQTNHHCNNRSHISSNQQKRSPLNSIKRAGISKVNAIKGVDT